MLSGHSHAINELEARSRLYVLAYWGLALFSEVGALNPTESTREFGGLMFVAMGLCAAMAIHLGFQASRATAPGRSHSIREASATSGATSEKVLRVQIERGRRPGRPLALMVGEVSFDRSRSGADAEAGRALAAAHELLRRYFEGEDSVTRLADNRVAAVIFGSVSLHEIERTVDRLNDDVRAWTRASLGGIEFNIGIVVDWSGNTSPELLLRQVNIAVRRAAISGRGRYVIAEAQKKAA